MIFLLNNNNNNNDDRIVIFLLNNNNDDRIVMFLLNNNNTDKIVMWWFTEARREICKNYGRKCKSKKSHAGDLLLEHPSHHIATLVVWN